MSLRRSAEALVASTALAEIASLEAEPKGVISAPRMAPPRLLTCEDGAKTQKHHTGL